MVIFIFMKSIRRNYKDIAALHIVLGGIYVYFVVLSYTDDYLESIMGMERVAIGLSVVPYPDIGFVGILNVLDILPEYTSGVVGRRLTVSERSAV